jgi:choline dehydrogenase-like flavoprotein
MGAMGTFWRGILKGSIGPRDNDSRFLLDVHSRDLPGEATMARYRDDDEVDLVIVGAGAGGSVLAQRLARHGWRVVILEAGPFWHPDEHWVSDEAGSHPLYWTQKRIIGRADPIELGKNNSGRGVGGSKVHYAGYTPRFHPSDLSTYTNAGVGADWPIEYKDLRPHYEQVEAELPVAGQDWPWGYETPRLLLASVSRRFPHGLCNNADQVGRYIMVQGATQTAGRWPYELRMYKAPPPEISSEQFYETDPGRGFDRGFSIQTVSPNAHRLGRARAGRRALGPGAARVQPLGHHWRAQ